MDRQSSAQGHTMIVRRNISLEQNHLDFLEPLVKEHSGNLSATIRDLIEFAELMTERHGSLEDAVHASVADKYKSPRELLIEDGFCAMIDYPMLEWFLKCTKDILVSPDMLDDIIDPLIINRMSELVDHLNRKWKDYGWQTTLIIEYDNDVAPETTICTIFGKSMYLNEFLSGMVGLFLARQKHLGITKVDRRTRSIRMDLQRRESAGMAQDDLLRYFGNLHRVTEVVCANQDFWQALIDLHTESDYNMVTIHRREFEDLLANRIPLDTTLVERRAREPDKGSRSDFLEDFKHLCETTHIVKHIDVDGSKILVNHEYRDPVSIGVIKEMLVNLLAVSGYACKADEVGRLIALQLEESDETDETDESDRHW